MEQKRNYQKELDKIIAGLGDKVPTLLLHACCAPCSSYVLEYLTQYFKIKVLYYNPNIDDPAEYEKRVLELKRLISAVNYKYTPELIEGRYDPKEFYDAVKGLEDEPERGSRCAVCYALRMEEAASEAKSMGADYFTTTLSISPMKNADWINEIGEALSAKYGVKHLTSDFKKRDGYKRSIELSAEYDLYRQNYCGCRFSKRAVQEGV